MDRPSNKELLKKLSEARSAILAGRYFIGLSKHLVADLDELGIQTKS